MNNLYEELINWIKNEAVKRFDNNKSYTQDSNKIYELAKKFNEDFINFAKELGLFSLNGKKLLLYSRTIKIGSKNTNIYDILNPVTEKTSDYKSVADIKMNDFYNELEEEEIEEIFSNLNSNVDFALELYDNFFTCFYYSIFEEAIVENISKNALAIIGDVKPLSVWMKA